MVGVAGGVVLGLLVRRSLGSDLVADATVAHDGDLSDDHPPDIIPPLDAGIDAPVVDATVVGAMAKRGVALTSKEWP